MAKPNTVALRSAVAAAVAFVANLRLVADDPAIWSSSAPG